MATSDPKISKTNSENYLSEKWLEKQPQEIKDEGKVRDTREKQVQERNVERKWKSEGKMY